MKKLIELQRLNAPAPAAAEEESVGNGAGGRGAGTSTINSVSTINAAVLDEMDAMQLGIEGAAEDKPSYRQTPHLRLPDHHTTFCCEPNH